MQLNKLSLTEAKLLLNTSISGKDLLFSTVNELIGLRAIKVVENRSHSFKEKYVIEKAEKFDDYSTGYYTKFYNSIQENYESLVNPDRIREALLTPYFLVEKVYRKCNKSYGNYKNEIKTSLKDKTLIKPTFFPWWKFSLTEEGARLKEALIYSLKGFEESLRTKDEEKVVKLVGKLGILILLTETLNKKSLSDLETIIEQTTPAISNFRLDVVLDAFWYMELNWFDAGFNILDLMRDD